MNGLQIFNNPNFGEIRTLDENGKVLFCGSDVAKALGYEKPNNAVNTHCKGATLKQGIIDRLGREQSMSFIPEGDLYRLIVNSKLPSAEKFERWVFDEVLPSIRKEGSYIAPELKKNMAEARLLNAKARVSNQWMKLAQQVPHSLGIPKKTRAVTKDGTAYLKLEAVARGLGFTQTQNKNGTEYTSIRWETVFRYLEELGFPNKVGKDDFIPENTLLLIFE